MLVSDVVDRSGIGRLQRTILVVFGLAFIADGFDAQALAYVAPLLAGDLGLERYELGPLFTASLIGLAVDGFVLSYLSDRIGRKSVFCFSMFLFGICTIAKGFASGRSELMSYQFIAGLGIGGAPPAALALMSEYMLTQNRSRAITTVAMGYLVGATLGRIVAASVLHAIGWAAVFFIGGAFAIAVGMSAMVWVPESARFLLSRPGAAPGRRIVTFMARLDPALSDLKGKDFSCLDKDRGDRSLSALFRDGRAGYTVILWTVVFLIGCVNYILFSWLAVLFQQSGVGLSQSILAATAFPLGSLLSSLWLSGRLKGSRAALLLAAFVQPVVVE